MTWLQDIGPDIASGVAAGVLLLPFERIVAGWASRRGEKEAANQGRGGSDNSQRADGDGNVQVRQQGTGNHSHVDNRRSYVDNSRHSSVVNHHSGGGEQDTEETVGTFIAIGLAGLAVLAMFFLAEDLLRVAYAALWGVTVGLGVTVALLGAKAGKGIGWQVASGAPWVAASVVSAWAWGCWAGVWGKRFAVLDELGRQFDALSPADPEAGFLTNAIETVGAGMGLLVDAGPEQVRQATAIVVALLLAVVAKIMSVVWLWSARASVRCALLPTPSGKLQRTAERHDNGRLKKGMGTFLAVAFLVSLSWWLLTGAVVPDWLI